MFADKVRHFIQVNFINCNFKIVGERSVTYNFKLLDSLILLIGKLLYQTIL